MPDLSSDENIVLKVHRHKLVLIFKSSFLILFVLLPPLFFWFGGQAVTIKGNELALFSSLYSAILLIGWMIFFIIWTDYYLDVLIVTDKRIIDIEQRGFFKREVSTVRLESIEDITINVSGMLATFLDYGMLKIQTAAENREFIIYDLPHPNQIKSTIYELQNKQLEEPKSVKLAP